MPLVLMRVAPYIYTPEGLKRLIENIPYIVATALTTGPHTAGELKPSEIEVKVERFGYFDVHQKDLEIIIWANYYPEREKNLDERQSFILQKVKDITSSSVNGYVWVLLPSGSFGEW